MFKWNALLNFKDFIKRVDLLMSVACKYEKVSDCKKYVWVKLSTCGALKRNIPLDGSVTNAWSSNAWGRLASRHPCEQTGHLQLLHPRQYLCKSLS